MTYALSAPLQQAIYARLLSDPAVEARIGAAIYDVVPPGPRPGTWISLGPEEVRDASDATAAGAEHRVTVSVLSDAAGFQTAKEAAGAVSDALNGADLRMSRGHLVSLTFLRARAVRSGKGELRRIDMTFRARVEDTSPKE